MLKVHVNFVVMEPKIEKGIPIPSVEKSTKPNPEKNKFYSVLKSIKVGDSFIVDNRTERAYVLITFKRLDKDKQFTSRTEGKKYRIWRIK